VILLSLFIAGEVQPARFYHVLPALPLL
jgi:hypothetical protein